VTDQFHNHKTRDKIKVFISKFLEGRRKDKRIRRMVASIPRIQSALLLFPHT